MKVVAVDVGGTRIKAGVVDEKGGLHEKKVVDSRAEEGKDALLETLVGVVNSLLGVSRAEAVGVAFASPLDPKTGVVYHPPNIPGMGVFNLGAYLKERLGVPVVVDNDANLYALGEWWMGAGQGAEVLLCITLGTGIGGGLVVGGELWHGAHGLGAEFGHVTVVKDGPLCNCGRRGCFEAVASSRYLVETYRRLSGKEDSPFGIYKAAKDGDKAALESWRMLARNVAVGLSSLANALDPDVVVIGGGLANAGVLLLDAVKLHFEPLLLPGLRGKVELRLASLRDYSAVWGAAYAAIKALGGGK